MEREDFPRVSLETIADWDRVRLNYQRAVVAQVDALIQQNHLAAEKESLGAHLLQYIDFALSMAQPNLRINGQRLDVDDNNGPNTEPFDEALDRHIWALAESRLKSQKQQARYRRTVPYQTEANIAQIVEQAQLADIEAGTMVEEIPDKENHPLSETWSPQAALGEDFRHFCATAEELKQTIPHEQERSQRESTACTDLKYLGHDSIGAI